MHLPFHTLSMNAKNIIRRTLFAGLSVLCIGFATELHAGGNYKNSPYGHDPNPVRVYYFGYDVTRPGFGLGTEINLSWTKMEKSGCKGSRVSDRQFRMIPNLGMFQNEAGTQSLFGNLEFNYGFTYRHGLTIEFFGAGGYAQMLSELSNGGADNQKTSGTTPDESPAHSGFMPQAGVGIGYDFQKLSGKDFPLELNFRALATSTNIAESEILPALQAGLIYSF